MSPEAQAELQKIIDYMTTGQWSGLDDGDVGGSDQFEDYLNGPSMASILVENAKNQTLQEQYAKSREANDGMAPMIASIKQLDR